MTWSDDMHQVHEEAAGVMTLDVVLFSDIPDLLVSSLMGDHQSSLLMRAIGKAFDAIAAAPRSRPTLCACCPRPIKQKVHFSLAIATPARDDPANCLSLAVCAKCATTREDARQKAMSALRRIWPDARTVELTHPAGHA